jgi:large subunit ribosomal protein L25
MSENVLELTKREKSGTAYANQLRRAGQVPGVFYFHGEQAMPFLVAQKNLQTALSQKSTLIDVRFKDGDKDGEERKCILRDIQYDPLTHAILHIDFMGILLSEKISVSVPLRLIGTPVGVKTDGGIMQQLMREVEIECLPTDIPEAIDLDVAELKIGDSLHLTDLVVNQFKVLGDLNRAVVSISQLRIVEEAPVVAEVETAEPEVITARKTEAEEESEKK